ncbi:hypothetical protein [Haloplanus halobius]|uniref:hypothetical protein n=1 Tax=Haloplanus halobius TaxID=2934938 RepID=UPI00200E8F37|nr:hypothetical protein [Haloplanus sp. XH21]
MKRRSLLRTLPVLATGLGGCLAPRGDGGSDPPRRVTERALRDTGRCSEPESATVDTTASRIRVTGCITGPNGCAVARLESATLDEETMTVTVTTGSDEPPGTACTQALVYRGYVATIRVAGGAPSAVRVVHDVPGGRRTVVTA